MFKKIKYWGMGLALLLGAMQVYAVEFNQVVTDQSKLTFVSKQMGVGVDGKFGKFSASIAFDPAHLQTAKAQLDIVMSSIDAGSNEANDEVKDKEWFNVKAFPTAKFVSTAIKALDKNRYEIAGNLTIKGKTKPVTATFTMVPLNAQPATARFEGGFVLKRNDFGIGEGNWADPSVVADEVQIKFNLVAKGK
ncbi:MAG: YceI family protein [Pseudomonadota bacterium]